MKAPNLPAVVKPSLPEKRIEELERSSHELEKLGQGDPAPVLEWAGTMDLMKSSVLTGFLGGAVGSAAGVTLSGVAIAGFALPAVAITGPLGMAAGVAVAILAWRGRDWWRVEKDIGRAQLHIAQIDIRIRESLKQIGELPAKTPQEVRDVYWKAHIALVNQRQQAEGSVSDQVVPAIEPPDAPTDSETG